VLRPVKTRIEETMEFAKRMGYRKLGVAFCGGLFSEGTTLFLKHAKALPTVLVVKDRVPGHNPVAALYGAKGYFQRLVNP
jgi:uncharacterized metal-binding protein